ncbi:hypothetical protein [Maribacter flavus]|uniref:Uncharacterized protein n=1 Tax=Maribacter flavus TaxID=1658664 RepID=A0A5B2TPK9_9FLAO|nr:hypothetical protein [Maribacter flavus]KAA2215768.1 hypothetical protein F0361_16365 [Maribacter flavus]
MFFLSMFILLMVSGNVVAQQVELEVMPYPKNVLMGKGGFRINSKLVVSVACDGTDGIALSAANRFMEGLRK